ncbi:hypothetical protein C8R45DRAFT_1102712 [Mycena sanguinolenta]|nr:hypothetical protein C8R45DRAFT_1102712 [Mycena sanguinolenta]
MPTIRNACLVSTAFITGENTVLEWLGDAMISGAVLACASLRGIDCDLPENCTILGCLRCERSLAHMSFLYGLQLHEYFNGAKLDMPDMARTCDILESLVGAAASDDADPDDPDRG